MKYSKEEVVKISANNTEICKKLDSLLLDLQIKNEIIKNYKEGNKYTKQTIKDLRRQLIEGTKIVAFNN